jgi:hypothetical protein
VDLRGQTVIPGLADNHFHSIGGGSGVDLSRARTLDDVLAAIRARAWVTPPSQVIVTNSDWHEGQLREHLRLKRRGVADWALVGGGAPIRQYVGDALQSLHLGPEHAHTVALHFRRYTSRVSIVRCDDARNG